MSKPLVTADKRALARDGFVVSDLADGVLAQQSKATYYRRDGTAMPNLPADRRSMQRYLGRGFTLQPPADPEETQVSDIGVDAGRPPPLEGEPPAQVYVCELCEREFQGPRAKTALLSHKRSRKYQEALAAFEAEALDTIGG